MKDVHPKIAMFSDFFLMKASRTKPQTMSSKKKDKKGNKGGFDDFLHTKPEKWTSENIRMFSIPAIIMALIPSCMKIIIHYDMYQYYM